MAEVIFKGFFEALAGGDLEGTPDIRLMLVMSDFTGEAEEDAVNLSDITDLDEFDGVGYSRVDCDDVVVGYDDDTDEWTIDMADAVFGDPVAPGTDDIHGCIVYLHVDGDPDNDVALGFTDQGGFGVNANNGSLSLIIPAGGLLYVKQAA